MIDSEPSEEDVDAGQGMQKYLTMHAMHFAMDRGPDVALSALAVTMACLCLRFSVGPRKLEVLLSSVRTIVETERRRAANVN